MDTLPTIRYTTTPFTYPPVLPNTTKPIGTGVTQCPGHIVPNNQPSLNRPPHDQPLLKKYHYILTSAKKRNDPCNGGAPLPAPASRQSAVEISPVIQRWIGERENNCDRRSNGRTASKTSDPGSSAGKKTNSLHEPVAPGVGSPVVDRVVAEALYGPFSRSNDYATPTKPLILSQETIEVIEIEDSEDKFEDVMVYYRAAIKSDQIFGDTSLDTSTTTWLNRE